MPSNTSRRSSKAMTRRVVVTGMSVVTALGFEISECWDKLCAGKSGVSLLERFDVSEFKVRFGGEIKDFDPTDCIPVREVKRLDRFCQFAVYGAVKAIRQSGIDFSKGDAYRYGVVTGSGIGGLNEIEEQHCTLFDRGPSRVSPFKERAMLRSEEHTSELQSPDHLVCRL